MSSILKSKSSSVVIELALVTVRAAGDVQDFASEVVSLAGGRLLSLDDSGFTAQVTNRPEAIDAMLQELHGSVPIDVVRSGGLTAQ